VPAAPIAHSVTNFFRHHVSAKLRFGFHQIEGKYSGLFAA
jgi:hypothetical protein